MSNGEKEQVHKDARAKAGLPAAPLAGATVDGAFVRPGTIKLNSADDNIVVWFNEVAAPMVVTLRPNLGKVDSLGKHAFAVIRKGAPVGEHDYGVVSGGKDCEGNSAPKIIIR